jgi:hypothetical protein
MFTRMAIATRPNARTPTAASLSDQSPQHRPDTHAGAQPSIRPTFSALTTAGAPNTAAPGGWFAKAPSANAARGGVVVQRGKGQHGNRTRDLFGRGDTTKYGLHKVIKKQSKRKVRESEHMLPMQVVKKLFPGATPDNEPTHSIAYEMHRSGQSGAGGGITSTGSSSTASAWAAHLANLHTTGHPEEMYRQVALDTYHSARATDQDPEQTLVQINGLLNEHVGLGRLSDDQAGTIMNGLVNHHLDWRG